MEQPIRRSSVRALCGLPVLLLANVGATQSPRLLRDINSLAVPTASYPRPDSFATPRGNASFVSLLNLNYFVATEPVHGLELYQTSGTAASTRLVGDLNPGPLDSRPSNLTPAGVRLFFAAEGLRVGRELWVADPLQAKVYQVAEINQAAGGSSNPCHLLPLGHGVLFQAQDVEGNAELWRSDGTASGTHLVMEIVSSPYEGSRPSHLVRYRRRSYFIAFDGRADNLWSTDGTAVGTARLADVVLPRSQDAMVVYGDRLYFVGTDAKAGDELWSTDGTRAGTRLVHDLWSGSRGSNPGRLLVARGKLFFVADGLDPSTRRPVGRELWQTDGSQLVLYDLLSGTPNSSPAALTSFGLADTSPLYFVASGDSPTLRGQATGRELWRLDGAGVQVLDLRPGAAGAEPYALSQGPGGALYFVGRAASGGDELFRSDGTVRGTQLVKKINGYGNPEGSTPAYLTQMYGGDLLFAADDGPHSTELWCSDGSMAGTQMVRDINPPQNRTRAANPRLQAVVDGWTYFTVDVGHRPRRLWMTDGTSGNTLEIPSLAQRGVTAISAVAGAGRRVFVVAEGNTRSGASVGTELWALDRYTGVTTLLDLAVGPTGSDPEALCMFRGVVYFAANGDLGLQKSAGCELWRSDGTVQGSRLVADLKRWNGATPASSEPRDLTVCGHYIYFTAGTDSHGRELWRTDGTTAGTELVEDLNKGLADADPSSLTALAGRLLFIAETPWVGRELFVTDAVLGVTRCIELIPGPVGGFPQFMPIGAPPQLTRVGAQVYFPAAGILNGSASNDGTELWCSDGTLGGTRQVADLFPGPSSSWPSSFVALGNDGDFAFIADRGASQAYAPAIFFSDGTTAGTRLVKGVNHGLDVRFPDVCGRLGSRHALFKVPIQGRRGIIRHDLLISDGTTMGTRALSDKLAMESYRLGPARILPTVGGRLLLVCDEPMHGAELWVYDGLAIAEPVGSGCSSRVQAPTLRAGDPAGAVVRPQLAGGESRALGILMVGRTASAMELTGSCHLHVDLAGPQVFLPFATDIWGRWRGALSTTGAVAGFHYAMQAVVDAPLGNGMPDFTNGLELSIGK